jgi:hypothetical protein
MQQSMVSADHFHYKPFTHNQGWYNLYLLQYLLQRKSRYFIQQTKANQMTEYAEYANITSPPNFLLRHQLKPITRALKTSSRTYSMPVPKTSRYNNVQ